MKDRAKETSQYYQNAQTSLSSDKQNPIHLTLALSRRLIAGVKVKKILNIEGALDMVALAMAISSAVGCAFFFFLKI